MKKLQLKHHCGTCAKDVLCNLCSAPVCAECVIINGGKQLCRRCTSTMRNDYTLIDEFMEWHQMNRHTAIKITNGPMQRDIDGGQFGAHVEFETDGYIGFVSVVSNGSCDVNLINVNNGQSVLNSFEVCHSREEISELLQAVYDAVIEQASAD